MSYLVEIVTADLNDKRIRHRFEFPDAKTGRQFATLAEEAYDVRRVRTFIEEEDDE